MYYRNYDNVLLNLRIVAKTIYKKRTLPAEKVLKKLSRGGGI